MRAARKLLNNVQNSCRPLVVVVFVAVVAVDVVPQHNNNNNNSLLMHIHNHCVIISA